MKIEIVQLAGRDGDTAYNLNRAQKAIATCAPDTDIVIFPESYLTGFLDVGQLAACAEPLDGPSVRAITAAARERNVAVVIGLIERDGDRHYNTTVLVTPDGVALSYRKTHLWVSEPGVVLPGDRYATVEWRGVRVGILICYDIEFPEGARALADLGAQLFLVTNGNMDPFGYGHRTAIMARAQENQVFAVMVNRVGDGPEGIVFAGGSAAVDPFGRMLVEAGRDECRAAVELDFSRIEAARSVYNYHVDRRVRTHAEKIEHPDGRREMLIGS
ncbi:carbon-nitrogen hydrolase family protein [Burkholderia guangdongensis]|uniref:carbon-nitrogen hydrolase family protein n=1 Tax=Burkholderia guangdongensis TaxID=1792500 RepID=UPI0015C766E4|nr:carbon-nitrogen hydrolase family protein [Burkholderia guangdongensis]